MTDQDQGQDSPVATVITTLGRDRPVALVRRFDHGAGGTSVITLDGTAAVLKAWPRSPEQERALDLGLRHAGLMARRGVPIAGLLERGVTDRHCYLIYELVRGDWPPVVGRDLIEQLVEIVDAERGAAPTPDPDWHGTVARLITVGDPGLDISPAKLAGHPRGAPILAAAHRALSACDPAHLVGTDIVHGDFAPENVLVADGRISAVVDWEQSRAGDATLDLAGVLYDVALGDKADAAGWDLLHAMITARARPEVLRLCLAVYAIRYASWSIDTEMESEVLAVIDRLHEFGA